MAKPTEFEVPSDAEKLPHKFILESLKRRALRDTYALEEVAPVAVEPEPPAGEQACGTQAPVEEAPPTPEAPAGTSVEASPLQLPHDKPYFRINEVAEIIGVEPHVLRYWQGEFKGIRPRKARNGHWVYSRKDVETFHAVRHLLYVEKYSVAGARLRLKEAKTGNKAPVVPNTHPETLREVAKELKELIQFLRSSTL